LREPECVNDDIPTASSLYVSVEDEMEYMKSLMSQSISKYCQYLTYKMFHFIRIAKKIILTEFIAFFCENEVGDYEFNDCIIHDLTVDPYDFEENSLRQQDLSEFERLEFTKEAIEEYIQMKLRNERMKRVVEEHSEKEETDERQLVYSKVLFI